MEKPDFQVFNTKNLASYSCTVPKTCFFVEFRYNVILIFNVNFKSISCKKGEREIFPAGERKDFL